MAITWNGLRRAAFLLPRETGLCTPLPKPDLGAKADVLLLTLECCCCADAPPAPSSFLSLHRASFSFLDRPALSMVLDYFPCCKSARGTVELELLCAVLECGLLLFVARNCQRRQSSVHTIPYHVIPIMSSQTHSKNG